ncbi:MAG: phosphatase PAP2 family protein [Aquabacterium sp.]|jgi:lipid A 4'-phosphatase|uniref:phosphatase PAP2 family protein n=1 Tax=Aquabacterium sp. TaxID=1872578 RepID=UPI001B6A2A37|nr:phosphatase PAP2 family protein [Aquabacterium sp.]MBP7132176.1 phosphatase PAP2 family protein [Aquabacterium sp.]MBP9062612.1 phosphatase PAP2 family protein [Aquabacterium sp.]MDQ5925451.1 acidPPc protein [Pseudomonadota bacterium]
MTRTRRKSAEGDTHDEESLHRLNHLVWAVFFFSTAIFTKFPGLDLLISVRYYDAARGFIHRSHPVVLALYDWTPWIGRALVIALAVYALLAPLLARHFDKQGEHSLALRARGSWRHLATVAVVCGLLGPGLIIEGIFKNQMGRPRPVQVLEFGGAQAYQGPFVTGITPERNRSFVSSHAATGFWLMSLGLTCGPLWRRRWLLIGMMAGGAIGLGRILQGGHFFSDILFAFFTVWLSCEIVAWLDKHRRSRHTGSPR